MSKTQRFLSPPLVEYTALRKGLTTISIKPSFCYESASHLIVKCAELLQLVGTNLELDLQDPNRIIKGIGEDFQDTVANKMMATEFGQGYLMGFLHASYYEEKINQEA